MKVSKFLAEFLQNKGIHTVFELSGGMITHMLDSIYLNGNISIISMHHEQAAAFAAEGFGRVTGLPGVALATSGPGATNLLTGIGSCYFDSTPAIFITGQVNRHELKGIKEIRQLGFQETDIVSMASPITKWSVQVLNADDIPLILEKAYQIAIEGRPGPVLIDIPMDIQRMELGDRSISVESKSIESASDVTVIEDMIDDICAAQRPIILAGRGIRASGSKEFFDDFLRKTKIPVVTSLLGIDTIEYSNPLRVGFIGSYGNRWANIGLGESDLLIVLGSRLDIRQTGADVDFFANRKIYHVDCINAEINNRVKGCYPVNMDLKIFFKEFENISNSKIFPTFLPWVNRLNELRSTWPDIKELQTNGINPNVFVHQLSQKSKLAVAILADVGSHQMWTAQSIEISGVQQFLTSGGMGAMGFSLPAAIGACTAQNNMPVVVLVGDGSIQINIQELETIRRNKLPVKIIVLNNNSLGMIRQFQDSYFESRYQSTSWGYSSPDFEKIGRAYEIESKTISNADEAVLAIEWLWNDDNLLKPMLLQVMIDPKTNAYPKIAFGRPLTEMEPFCKPIEMEGT